MNKVLLFNPDTEMAIVEDACTYTPRKKIAKMKQDLSLLPCWWGEGGDLVMADGTLYNNLPEKSRTLISRYGCHRFFHPESDGLDGYTAAPWGWNKREHCLFSSYGIHTPEWNSGIKELYSRKSAILLLRTLMDLPDLPAGCRPEERNIPGIVDSIEQFRKMYGKASSRPLMLKRPWSSSGRGNLAVPCNPDPASLKWMEDAFKTQGYLVVEPLYEDLMDFAMEFRMEKGKCIFLGYSVFDTESSKGSYKSNLVADNGELEEQIAVHVPCRHLNALHNACSAACEKLFGEQYSGYMGIDMMATPEGIIPCIEINFRMNMGILALVLNRRYGLHGTLTVSYRTPGTDRDLLLTPSLQDTEFHAFVTPD